MAGLATRASSLGAASITVTSLPDFASVADTSSPIYPPPITIAEDALAAALRRRADAAFAFDVRDDGAMVVSVGGAEFRLASTFSEAGGGSNALGGGGTGPSWSVAVHRNTDGSVEVLGRGSLYTIRRVVTRRQHRLLVNDTVSVHAPQAQGVACAHTATLPRSR